MADRSRAQLRDLYKYTSGRWLWDEESQLQKWYRRFNVPELMRIAAKDMGARECTSISKVAESGSNKIFRLTMNDGRAVIARIPHIEATRAPKTIASEVATMELARTILDIPVPKVLSWSGGATNPVQSEYILMEEATGEPLLEVWDGMRDPERFKIVQDIVATEQKFLRLSFTGYGCLYFAEDAFPGCEKAEIVGQVTPVMKNAVESRFVIGPVVNRWAWHRERASMDIDRGPWTKPHDYLRAIGNREIAWLRSHAANHPHKTQSSLFPWSSAAQGTPSAHITLYEKFLAVSKYLVPQGDLARPTLWHWDINAPNMFVKDGRISALIDWQEAWVGPLLLQAQEPPFIGIAESHTNGQTYKAEMKKSNPTLHDIAQIKHRHARRHAISRSVNTWDDDLMHFRNFLMLIACHWHEINNKVPCPIRFSDEDMRAHRHDLESWSENTRIWAGLQGTLTREGWMSYEKYEQTHEKFGHMRDYGKDYGEAHMEREMSRTMDAMLRSQRREPI